MRAYVISLVRESVARYDCDGLELDFNRFPRFFGEGSQDDRIALMNELVEQVRRLLDEEGNRKGPIP